MINTVYIMLICVLVIDQTDFMTHVKKWLSKWLTKGKIANGDYELKPLDCSLCMSFWSNLIYIIICGLVTFPNLVIILALAIATPIVNGLITLITTLIEKILNAVTERIDK